MLSRVPFPLEKGDKLRAFHQLRLLQSHFKVCLVALSTKALHPQAHQTLAPLCDELHVIPISKCSIASNLIRSFVNGKPFQVGFFYNTSAKKQLQEIISVFNPNVVYGQLVRTAEYLIDTDRYKILDLQDALSKGVERRIGRAFGPMRWILNSEMKRLIKYEELVIQNFDHCTIISEQDRQVLPSAINQNVTIVRNGVDMDHFSPQEVEKNTDILFAGNMGYPPNILAGQFLAKDVLPLLCINHPNIRLSLAGATPSPTIKSLASSNVEVTGWVDDMRSCYARARIFVAPMMIGTGLQNKLLEAMSMGMPCITTELANNPLGATPDKHLLIARTPNEFAQAIEKLITSPEKANDLGAAGRKFIQQNYGWEAQTEPLIGLLKNSAHIQMKKSVS